MRKTLILTAILLLAAAAVALLPTSSVLSQSFREVRVLNFPDAQRIEGKVEVPNPIPHSKFLRRPREIVPPVRREEVTKLVEGGVLEVDGFTEVVLSLQGEVRGTLYRGGTVGAILIPDEEPIVEAFNLGDRLQFPLEVKADVAVETAPYFSAQVTKRVAFPRYRVYFYNSSDKSVEAYLYLYLGH